VQAVANRALKADNKAREKIIKDQASTDLKNKVNDSFVNFSQSLGMGADNPMSSSSYGFNPITRIRTQLEWIHRGSWLGGVAIDVVAEDMTRAGVDVLGGMDPAEMETLNEAVTTLGIWSKIKENTQWSRLYGGSIAVMLIDGQDPSTPLRLERVGKGQFKGLLVLDRWMVEPSLTQLVTELGPDLGNPMFYTVTADAPALPRAKIHYSRVIRQVGITLPYWQRVQENLWGLSVIERLYDRMVMFDSATTGAGQLVYKSYLRTVKIKGLRELIAAGGQMYQGLVNQINFMKRYQTLEGITILDGEDEMTEGGANGFGGLAEALTQFGQQLSGALQIPLVRLFGQSPSGFNSGDSDIRLYYDDIKQQQESCLKVGLTRIYRAIAQSEGLKVPDGFKIEFRSLWQLSEKEKSEIAVNNTNAVTQAQEAGLISDKTAAKELRQSGHQTGVFTNITDEEIESMSDDLTPPPAGEEALGDKPDAAKTDDSPVNVLTAMSRVHGLDVAIENQKGSYRHGEGWSARLAADYGYIRRAKGADGDEIDCFIGPDLGSDSVWVINQRNMETGAFDEHKCMLGYSNMGTAMADYVKSYPNLDAWSQISSVKHMHMADFKAWLADADLSQPCMEMPK
jgi:hypothetical protein